MSVPVAPEARQHVGVLVLPSQSVGERCFPVRAADHPPPRHGRCHRRADACESETRRGSAPLFKGTRFNDKFKHRKFKAACLLSGTSPPINFRTFHIKRALGGWSGLGTPQEQAQASFKPREHTAVGFSDRPMGRVGLRVGFFQGAWGYEGRRGSTSFYRN